MYDLAEDKPNCTTTAQTYEDETGLTAVIKCGRTSSAQMLQKRTCSRTGLVDAAACLREPVSVSSF